MTATRRSGLDSPRPVTEMACDSQSAGPLRRFGKPLRVLLAVDDHLMVLDFAAIIQHLGGEIAGIAERTEAAVELVTKLDPDIVVMDVGIDGDVDSIDAADVIRSCFDVPVVFATDDDDPVLRIRMYRVTEDEPVPKPDMVSALRGAILRALASGPRPAS